MSKVYLVTGANSGLGKETCRQLALLADTKRVYLCARTEDKAKKAIDDLVAAAAMAGDGGNNSGPVAAAADALIRKKVVPHHFDPNEGKETIVEKTVKSLVEGFDEEEEVFLHGVVLNAGSRGALAPTEPNGVTAMAQINLIGHVHLVDGLADAKKIGNRKEKDGVQSHTRVVFIGSETARGGGFAESPRLEDKSEQDFRAMLDGAYYNPPLEPDASDPHVAYAAIKGIGALYFAGYVRVHRFGEDGDGNGGESVYAVTVSPGGTSGTEWLTSNADAFGGKFVAMLMKAVLLPVLTWLGKVHPVDVGAKRYVDAVTGGGGFDFEAGTFVASREGLTGPLSDQSKTAGPGGAVYGDHEMQDMVYKIIHDTYS